ncbi:hypothetical protein ERJ75_001410300 [Trypanosoma vivax]|nr:hypothetical protein TRVL_01040 [Trypanosoma vivax]KAH8607445.1 hypothetical protein ERJ75_001410300 [Trypanosoma vivax]
MHGTVQVSGVPQLLRGGLQGYPYIGGIVQLDKPRTMPVSATLPGFIRSLFHFATDDTVILAMEHNHHSKLLAVSTSRNEIFVISTRDTQLGAGAVSADVSVWLGSSTAATLIDQVRFPCTHLTWAPWQHGVCLACVCRGKQVRLYRLSCDRWTLETIISLQDCVLAAFSTHFTLACVSNKDKISVFAESVAGGDAVWSPSSTYHLNIEGNNFSNIPDMRGRSIMGCTCLDWDETGGLLAVGDSAGAFRVLYVSCESRRISYVVYGPRVVTSGGTVQQVSWSPGAGRSFIQLAVVGAEGMTIFFFKRPLFGSPGYVQGPSQMRLQLIAQTCVEKDGIIDLAWNVNGTRVFTTHTCGTLSVWAVVISFRRLPLEAPAELNSHGSSVDASRTSGSSQQEGQPVLHAFLRRISTAYLYNNTDRCLVGQLEKCVNGKI